eukprot:TRINITY_DN9953_c0_g1_i1.p2 TRINITY_DN9953_c0_g1~~TRINITY_DN9953_c0_g1_i1.p2  ORF type:complete len:353 (+),score=101.27 TRINITY_DN9953_c0_g1_i1:85-1143(+)
MGSRAGQPEQDGRKRSSCPPSQPPERAHRRSSAGDGNVWVVVVRHGERLDEADKPKWRSIRTEETRSDPPLTRSGWGQGLAAGEEVAAELKARLGAHPRPTLYSSNTVRTLSTAAAAAPPLDAKEVVPVYALNCCAAAKERGVQGAFPRARPPAEATGAVKLACWPPRGDPRAVDALQQGGRSFACAVYDLAAQHRAGDVVVMVTHREGIWDLQSHLGSRMRQRYCSVHWMRADLQRQVLAPWHGASEQAEPSPAPAPRPVAAVVPPPGVDPLLFTLQQGGGRLRVAAGPQRLWRTPGVHGQWVSERVLQTGDALELRCTPQASEGDEGDFVRVRCETGEKGWLPVSAVTLP